MSHLALVPHLLGLNLPWTGNTRPGEPDTLEHSQMPGCTWLMFISGPIQPTLQSSFHPAVAPA